MALVWFEGMDGLVTADIGRFLSDMERSSVTAARGAFGGQGLAIPNGAATYSRRGVAAGRANRAAGWLMPATTPGSDPNTCLGFGSNGASSSSQTGAWVYSNGTVRIVAAGSVQAEVHLAAFQGPCWVEVESTPTLTRVFVNGLLRASYGGSIGTSLQLLGGQANIQRGWVDDLFFWNDDPSGDVFTGFPIGPQRIQTLSPSGPGASAEWDSLSGPNWQAVASTGWAGATGVTTTETEQVDLHAVEAVAWDSALFSAAQLRASGLNLGALAAAVRLLMNGAGSPIRTAALPLPFIAAEVFFAEPVTTGLSLSTLSAVQIGYESEI